MSLYQTVKSAITVRQVGEMYGMEPDRHGMVCCPFHSDNHPSMMLNESYYYCISFSAACRGFRSNSLAVRSMASPLAPQPKQ